jgi:Domain of unknown function (DUF4440)
MRGPTALCLAAVVFACPLIAQQPKTVLPATGAAVSAELSTDAREVLELERKIGEAIVRGDTAFYDRVTSSDFIMTHSDRWTTGGKPLLVDDKISFRKRIENRSYLSYDLDSVKIEMHGDVAITYGRYVASMKDTAPERKWFSVWFEKVYAKRGGQWQYLSHKTVNGANYGPDRESVSNK